MPPDQQAFRGGEPDLRRGDQAEQSAPMTDTARPEIGRTVDAAGIATNVLEAGPTGAPTVLLLHGSGPGVSAYEIGRAHV